MVIVIISKAHKLIIWLQTTQTPNQILIILSNRYPFDWGKRPSHHMDITIVTQTPLI